MIIDASVILCAFFPDEAQPQAQRLVRDHIAGRLHLMAPSLLPYELANAVWLAERRGRIDRPQADQILETIDGLDIDILEVGWVEMMPFARQYQRTAYDAAYLGLAQAQGQPLITADLRLYNAVHTDLGWVRWIGDYTSEE
jgi:predicted nucleic acid-binding protein